MYIPDLTLASYRIDLGDKGAVVLFRGYTEFAGKPNPDNYSSILSELSKEGVYRNVYRVDSNGNPVWRVNHSPLIGDDEFMYIEMAHDSSDYLIGNTFQGFIYRISISDGKTEKIGWSRS